MTQPPIYPLLQEVLDHLSENEQMVEYYFDEAITNHQIMEVLLHGFAKHGLFLNKGNLEFCNYPVEQYYQTPNLPNLCYYHRLYLVHDEKWMKLDWGRQHKDENTRFIGKWVEGPQSLIQDFIQLQSKNSDRKNFTWHTKVVIEPLGKKPSWILPEFSLFMDQMIDQVCTRVLQESLEAKLPKADETSSKFRL